MWRWRFSGSDRSTGRVGHEKAGWHEWWIVRQGQGRGMGMGFVLRRCETRRRPAGRPPTNGPWSVVSYFGDEEGDGMGEVEKKCVAGWPLRAGRSGSVTHPPRPRPARSITFLFPSTPGLRLCPTVRHCSLHRARVPDRTQLIVGHPGILFWLTVRMNITIMVGTFVTSTVFLHHDTTWYTV